VRGLVPAFALAASAFAAAAGAQAPLAKVPAETLAIAPTGVDMRTGRFAHQETDLSIGGEGETGGLALTRIAAANVPGHLNPFGNFSSNWDVMVVEARVDLAQAGTVAGSDYRITVHFGGRTQTFTGLNGWSGVVPASRTGNALMSASGLLADAGTVYTFTASDGTVVTFRPIGSADCSDGLRCAFVSSIVYPDGTRLAFDYAYDSSRAGNRARLKSVTSSRGYALLFEGAGSLVSKACPLNLAQAVLPADGLCPASAPAALYGYAGTRLASATVSGRGTSAYTYDDTAHTMGFVKPGQTLPWMVTTLGTFLDEMGVEETIVLNQARVDGQTYAYTWFSRAPKQGLPPVLAGGRYVNATGQTLIVRYGHPETPPPPCSTHPCPVRKIEDLVYQTTTGPDLISDELQRQTESDYCEPMNATPGCVVGDLRSFTVPSGMKTDLDYDAYRNLTRVVRHPRPLPDGSVPPDIVTSATYDCANRYSCSKPKTVTDARGKVTEYTYAPEHGGILTETLPAPTPNAPRPQKRYSYEARYARTADGAAAGPQVWLLTRMAFCKTSEATANGCAAGAADEVVTTYDYGPDSAANNLLLRATIVDAGGLNLRTCHYYDAVGNKVAEISPKGAVGGCPVTAPATATPFMSGWRFDVARRLTGTISADPDGTGPLHHAAVRNSYDSGGRLTKVETGELASWQPEGVDPAAWPGFAVFQTVDTAYDALDRKVSERLSGASGPESFTQYRYDLEGRVLCTAVRMKKSAFPARDAAPPQPDACAQGEEGSEGPDRVTRNDYDPAGQLTAVWKAYGTPLQQRYAAYEYSLTGKQTAVIDANGNRAEMIWDGFDRQQRWIFPSPTTAGQVNAADYEEYGYDADGNRTSLRKRDQATLNFTYDALNRVTLKTVSVSATGAAGYSVFYVYDNRGLQTSARFGTSAAPGSGVTSDYDSAGRQVRATSDMGGSPWSLAYGWDEDGNRTGVGGIVYRYDGLDRPTDIFNGGPANPLAAFGYAADGGVKWVGNIWSTSVTAATRLERDGAGRLGRVTQEMAGLVSNQTDFLYNPASQIVQRSTGNRAYLWTPPHEVSRTYAPNGLNQYASASGTGAAAYQYDLNGNLRSDGATAFVYDAENRLVSARGAKNADLTYDPLGRLSRVWDPTTATTTATRFFYDGDRLVYETSDTGSPRHYYVHGNGADQPLIWWDFTGNNVRRFLHADQQGSIVAVSRGDTGAAVAINSYDAWGVPGANNAALRFGYTGQAWIPELGLWYYKARFYSAALGRFLQVDPVGYKDQNNLYAYVGNDPIDRRDPTGMCSSIANADVRADCLEKRADSIKDAQVYLSGQSVNSGRDEPAYIATFNENSGEVTVRTGEKAGVQTGSEVAFTDNKGKQLIAKPDGRIIDRRAKRDTNEIVLATGHGHPKENPGGGEASRSLNRANDNIRDNQNDKILSRVAPAVIKGTSGKIRVYSNGKEME
jgi:RHS repeat-associated protein